MPKTLALCIPGSTFPSGWMQAFADLLIHLRPNWNLQLNWAESNNIYLVRNMLVKTVRDAEKPSDYVLWIDSDNPPSVEGFEWLVAAIEATPEVSAVGGWYRFFGPKGAMVAAGTGDRYRPTEDEILASTELIEVGYIGFGFLLMRTSVLLEMGEDPFQPMFDGRFATDDGGFCDAAVAKGYKFYLHPKVFVEHLKMGKVPARQAG